MWLTGRGPAAVTSVTGLLTGPGPLGAGTVRVQCRPSSGPAARSPPDAVLTGDPGRAMMLAQELLTEGPKMTNHARGLWGYTGLAADGRAPDHPVDRDRRA